jgi:hypothetical protein
MEQYPNVGYVHCERDYIDEKGKVTDLDPFYTCNFVAPGESVLPIYMVTDVGQPAQSLIRKGAFRQALGYCSEFDHLNADKDLWFRLSLVADYAYLREKLALIRIHGNRETTVGFKTFYHPLAVYLTIASQGQWGALRGYGNVVDRLPVAYARLSSECLSIARSCLRDGERELANQYLVFSEIVHEDIVNDAAYRALSAYLEGGGKPTEEASDVLVDDTYRKRKRGYNPPAGYRIIEV